jgi:hypothetical protein
MQRSGDAKLTVRSSSATKAAAGYETPRSPGFPVK